MEINDKEKIIEAIKDIAGSITRVVIEIIDRKKGGDKNGKKEKG